MNFTVICVYHFRQLVVDEQCPHCFYIAWMKVLVNFVNDFIKKLIVIFLGLIISIFADHFKLYAIPIFLLVQDLILKFGNCCCYKAEFDIMFKMRADFIDGGTL